jgi:hypothetical protein
MTWTRLPARQNLFRSSLSSLIAATFDRAERLQYESHAYALEKLTLMMGKTAEFSAIAELSAKQ